MFSLAHKIANTEFHGFARRRMVYGAWLIRTFSLLRGSNSATSSATVQAQRRNHGVHERNIDGWLSQLRGQGFTHCRLKMGIHVCHAGDCGLGDLRTVFPLLGYVAAGGEYGHDGGHVFDRFPDSELPEPRRSRDSSEAG